MKQESSNIAPQNDIIFLIPPSEAKTPQGLLYAEDLSFLFEKPYSIATNATTKDLKCQSKRYQESIKLNQNIDNGFCTQAITRYSGVMYNAIDYQNLTPQGKNFFQKHFFILSGMYGILKPLDVIGNYKLPIETKGLYHFWGDKITQILNQLQPKYIVNLLPGSYQKMIHFESLQSHIIHVNFLEQKDDKIKKISHGVKKIKGEWIRNICEKQISCYTQFGGEIVKNHLNIDINILRKVRKSPS